MGEIIRHEDLRQAAALAESVHALSGKRITANLIAAEVHIGAPFKMRVKVMLYSRNRSMGTAASEPTGNGASVLSPSAGDHCSARARPVVGPQHACKLVGSAAAADR